MNDPLPPRAHMVIYRLRKKRAPLTIDTRRRDISLHTGTEPESPVKRLRDEFGFSILTELFTNN